MCFWYVIVEAEEEIEEKKRKTQITDISSNSHSIAKREIVSHFIFNNNFN